MDGQQVVGPETVVLTSTPNRNYWHRVTGCALSWFVWDFAFYGNKLFQSNFINAVIGGAPTLIQVCRGWKITSAHQLARGQVIPLLTFPSVCLLPSDAGVGVAQQLSGAGRLLLCRLHGRQAVDGPQVDADHGLHVDGEVWQHCLCVCLCSVCLTRLASISTCVHCSLCSSFPAALRITR